MKYKVISIVNKMVVVNLELLNVNVFMEKGLIKLNDVKVFYLFSNYFIVEIKNLFKDYKVLKINFKFLDKEDENVLSNLKEMS